MATMEEAKAALAAYPFTVSEGGTVFVRFRPNGDEGDRYQAIEGGFLRFYKGEALPHSIRPEWAQVNGLDHTNAAQHDAFEWVWPPEEIVKVYGAQPGG